ncbi:MAG: hypothetical protein HDS57_04320 [Barnesiella sp.]|nr:hypothetical protein [Barnesiella sp.]MBD5374687.1 hypothetical protein [Bacteroides sp.]
MSGNLKRRLDNVTAKALLLRQRHEQILAERSRLESRVAELKTLLDQRDKEISRLRQENEYLRVVHSITPSRGEVERSRAILTELMRDIDKCIADLSD